MQVRASFCVAQRAVLFNFSVILCYSRGHFMSKCQQLGLEPGSRCGHRSPEAAGGGRVLPGSLPRVCSMSELCNGTTGSTGNYFFPLSRP